MTNFEVGQLVTYTRNTGGRRYCVIRRITSEQIFGHWEYDVETAMRPRSSEYAWIRSVNITEPTLQILSKKTLKPKKPKKQLVDGKNGGRKRK